MTKDDFTDHLNRKALAGQVLDTLLEQEQVKVMSLNGGWGSGKTYFLEYMKRHAEKNGILFITHNVWENDYLDDPFLSIVSIFLKALEPVASDATTPIDEDLENYWKETKKWAYGLAGLLKNIKFEFSPSFSWKTPEGWTYSVNAGKIKIEPEKPTEKADYISFPELKKTLIEKFTHIIKERNQTVIIAIDELDRTRPEYAIRTLEVIKHFFDIDGLKFILAVDKKQLQNTVKQMFGQAADTDCYLRKFVDLEWNLPEADLTDYVDALLKKYPAILECLQNPNISSIYLNSGYVTSRKMETVIEPTLIRKITGNDSDLMLKRDEQENIDIQNNIRSFLIDIYKSEGLTLRDLDKHCLNFSIALKKIEKGIGIKIFFPQLFFLLLIFNKKDSTKFNQFRQDCEKLFATPTERDIQNGFNSLLSRYFPLKNLQDRLGVPPNPDGMRGEVVTEVHNGTYSGLAILFYSLFTALFSSQKEITQSIRLIGFLPDLQNKDFMALLFCNIFPLYFEAIDLSGDYA